MGTFWEGNAKRQAAYDRLFAELVPASGPADTLEGECLRAAGKVHHECWNNGWGNNVSGPLIFLRDHFPGFKAEWWDVLGPLVTGEGPRPGDGAGNETTEEIADAVVAHLTRRKKRHPSPCDCYSLQVERTGLEEEFEEDEDDDLYADPDDDADEDDDDRPAFSR